jgi:hypothetical protein
MRFRSDFDEGFGWYKLFFALIVVIILTLIGLRFAMVSKSLKNGKTVYEINVNTFDRSESYMTNEFTRDKETGCISFKDEFGIKRIVCNNYTITQY